MAVNASKAAVQKVGDYDILELIAEGGMGSVYRARHRTTGAIVAVKILLPEMAGNSMLMKRFEQEFKVARSLEHPHIVRALDFGRDGTNCYLVMEFVDGPSLGQRIDTTGRFPESEAVRIITEVAQALQLAHEQGLVHRDVKPDNILLTSDGKAKVADLGLVKRLDGGLDLTRPYSGLGTPNFMAPEQFDDAKHADPLCDIYSLGATLYMMVTGELPFQGPTALSVLKKKTTAELKPAREVVPELSENCDRAIRRAMSLDARSRHATCLEFAEDLRGEGPPPAATLPAPIEAAPPPAPRNRPKAKERRASVRYPSRHEGSCIPVGGEEDPSWLAKIQDISSTGISLLLSRRFEPQTVLVLQLQGKGAKRPSPLLVRVVHVRTLPKRQWLHGCVFGGTLSGEEIQVLR